MFKAYIEKNFNNFEDFSRKVFEEKVKDYCLREYSKNIIKIGENLCQNPSSKRYPVFIENQDEKLDKLVRNENPELKADFNNIIEIDYKTKIIYN